MKDKFNSTVTLLSFLSFAFIFGMASVSNIFIPLYYNEQFKNCAEYLSLLTPIIFLLTFNNTLRAQFLLPFHKDREYVASLLLSFSVNIIVSIVLIPNFQVIGAIIGTVVAEFISMVFELTIIRKYISVKNTIKKTIPFLTIGSVMATIIMEFEKHLDLSWISLLLLIVIGGALYLILSFIYMTIFDKQNLNMIVSQLIKKIRR